MWNRWLGTFALCMLTTGCHLANNAVRNLTYEAKLTTAEVEEHCNYEKLARASWEAMRKTKHRGAFSKHYAEGFKNGFVDYLQFGGSGQPPYMPPKHYWGPRYRTPEGSVAIEDWYAGFRHGVAAAQESGYRQWVRLPSAQTTEPPPPVHSAAPVNPGRGMHAPLENNGPAPSHRLPPPKPLPPSEPNNTGSAPRPQTSAPPQFALGAPVSPRVIPASIQNPEPANVVISSEVVRAEHPIATEEPPLLVEVVNPTSEIAPRPAPDLTVPKDTDSTRRKAPVAAPVAETTPLFVFPSNATFGNPRALGNSAVN